MDDGGRWGTAGAGPCDRRMRARIGAARAGARTATFCRARARALRSDAHPGRQPDDRRQGRTRQAAVLRHPAERGRSAILLFVSRVREGADRRSACRGRRVQQKADALESDDVEHRVSQRVVLGWARQDARGAGQGGVERRQHGRQRQGRRPGHGRDLRHAESNRRLQEDVSGSVQRRLHTGQRPKSPGRLHAHHRQHRLAVDSVPRR